MPDKKSPQLKQLIAGLQEDLSREYQAVIAYTVYSNVLTGAQWMDIARELKKHAGEELQHAMIIADQLDYLGEMPNASPKPVKLSKKAEDMLRFDLENDKTTIANYRRRIKQADELEEWALSEDLREILRDEFDHLNALATALGEDTPDPGVASE